MKADEITYPARLTEVERTWLMTKPFGTFNREESQRTFADFSTVLTILNEHAPNAKRVVELGCGPGWLSVFLAQMGYEVSGYDLSPEMIDIARQRARDTGIDINFEVHDMDKPVPETASETDVVIIYDALHHCAADEPVLKNAYRTLRKGGILLLAEPNRVHATDADAQEAVARFGVTERGLDASVLRRICKKVGFRQTWRYHASGQSFRPRHNGLVDTLKMLVYPFLARFVFGAFRTRIWFVAER